MTNKQKIIDRLAVDHCERLIDAYEEILLLEFRSKITRDERMVRLKALTTIAIANGLSSKKLEVLIDVVVERALKLQDEVFSSSGRYGRWQ